MFQITRTEGKTVTGAILCNECQSYDKGYQEGKSEVEQYKAELLEWLRMKQQECQNDECTCWGFQQTIKHIEAGK